MLKVAGGAASGANGTVTSITAGTGITLTPNPITANGTVALANTAVTAGTYGNANTVAQVTVDAQGRLTNVANVSISIANSAVTGLGTMSTQNANAVSITGGNISGLSVPLAVASGGTGVNVSTGANSVVLRDANQNITGNSFFAGFTSVAASVTQITLTAASTPVYSITGSGGQVIQLPNATTLPNGVIFSFNNNQSSGAITVNNNSGTLIVSIPSGGYTTVVLLSNATAAGTWDRHDQTPSNVSWSTNTLDYPGSITNSTWNGNTVAVSRGGTGAVTLTGYVKGNGTSAFTASNNIPSSDITGLGTMSTQNANAVSITGGNIAVTNVSAANVTITSTLTANLTTNANATFATSSLLLVPEGYLVVNINGTNKKIPYYAT